MSLKLMLTSFIYFLVVLIHLGSCSVRMVHSIDSSNSFLRGRNLLVRGHYNSCLGNLLGMMAILIAVEGHQGKFKF